MWGTGMRIVRMSLAYLGRNDSEAHILCLSYTLEGVLVNSSIAVYRFDNQLKSGQLVKLMHFRLLCLRVAEFCFSLVCHTHCLLLNK